MSVKYRNEVTSLLEGTSERAEVATQRAATLRMGVQSRVLEVGVSLDKSMRGETKSIFELRKLQ